MINHYVMFRLLDFAEGATKAENAKKIKDILDALPRKIKEIKFYEIHLNQREAERAADVLLISKFNTWDDLDTYIAHPDHQKAADFIKLVREESKAVDFEY